MCDYSLEGFPSELAQVGDALILRRFPGGTHGFIADQPPKPKGLAAIKADGFWKTFVNWLNGPSLRLCVKCLPPGARVLVLDTPLTLRILLGIGENAPAKFTQVSMETGVHRDALHFYGKQKPKKLQDLPEDLRIRVCSLGEDESSKEEQLISELDYSFAGTGGGTLKSAIGRITRSFVGLD